MNDIEKIKSLLYENIDYMYCDNCRYNTEEYTEDSCDDCHRKYNRWGLSSNECARLAKLIVKELK